MSSAEEVELVNRLSTAEVIEPIWSHPVAVDEPQLSPANLIGLWDRTGTAIYKMYPHLKGKRLRNMTKAKEANEGEGSACNESDAQTNLAMNLLAHVVGRQAVKDKMDAAPKVMKAMKRANAKKAMKTMKAAAPKALKPLRAMKAAAPKDVKSMKAMKVVKAKAPI